MRLVLVAAVALTAALSPARADAPARWWSFEVPAGWTDTTADHAAERDQLRAQGLVVQGLVAYASPDAPIEVVVYDVRNGGGRGRVGTALSEFEAGARASITKGLPEVRYVQRDDGNARVVDHVVTGPDGELVVMRRIHGVDHGGQFVSVSALCSGSEPACTGVLLGLRADPAALQPFDADLGGSSSAYDTGYQLGRAVGVAGVLAIVIGLAMRKKRRDQQRANPAA
jgi:hypothetical protein